jgi:hypothetical protein
MKYMKLKGTENWAKIMGPVLDSYNNTKHSSTGIEPNKVNKDNQLQVQMNISKRAKKGNYPKINIGDDVRVPVVHAYHKGYKDSFSIEIHKVEDKDKGLYKVDGMFHPRKDLQKVAGNVIKMQEKTKAQKAANSIQNKVGKAQNNVEVKELIGTRTKKATKADIDTGIQTRSNDKKLRERKPVNYKV